MKILFLCLFYLNTWAFEVPTLHSPVQDEAKVLSPKAIEVMSEGIIKFKGTHQVQAAVLTVPSLEGLTIEEASMKVVESWKLGSKEQDQGVLLIFAPKERKIRIEVGQGLEGVLTDAQSRRILSSAEIFLAQKDYDAALTLTLAQTLNTIEEGLKHNPKPMPSQVEPSPFTSWLWVVVLIFTLFLLFS